MSNILKVMFCTFTCCDYRSPSRRQLILVLSWRGFSLRTHVLLDLASV